MVPIFSKPSVFIQTQRNSVSVWVVDRGSGWTERFYESSCEFKIISEGQWDTRSSLIRNLLIWVSQCSLLSHNNCLRPPVWPFALNFSQEDQRSPWSSLWALQFQPNLSWFTGCNWRQGCFKISITEDLISLALSPLSLCLSISLSGIQQMSQLNSNPDINESIFLTFQKYITTFMLPSIAVAASSGNNWIC